MYILCETMLNNLDVYCVFQPFRFFGPVPELLTAKTTSKCGSVHIAFYMDLKCPNVTSLGCEPFNNNYVLDDL